MATRQEYEQLKAFARIDGAWVGLLWLVSFAGFIAEFRMPLLGTLALLVGVGSIVFAAMRLRRFRDTILPGIISFRRAFAYSFCIYFYASLIMALGQYAYFQFLDGGYIMAQYAAQVGTPEFKELMTAAGVDEQGLSVAMDTLANLRPIDIAMQFLSTNLILGAAVSLPMAAMMARRNTRNKQ